MLLISGHGMRATDGQLYLASRITRMSNVEGTSVPWRDIAAALKKIPGRIVVFLDACHAGAADSANDLATSSIVDTQSIVVISASKGRQKSLERDRAGVFSQMMRRLVGQDFKKIDLNHNGAIELDELYRALKPGVLTATDGTQTPWVARNGMVGPVPLF